MEEQYENQKLIVKLTKEEIIKMLNGGFIKGFKIKQIGMITNE